MSINLFRKQHQFHQCQAQTFLYFENIGRMCVGIHHPNEHLVSHICVSIRLRILLQILGDPSVKLILAKTTEMDAKGVSKAWFVVSLIKFRSQESYISASLSDISFSYIA